MADIDEAAATRELRRKVRLAFYGLLAADERLALAGSMLKLAERVKTSRRRVSRKGRRRDSR